MTFKNSTLITFIVVSLTMVVSSCVYHKYGRDTHHAVFHLDLSSEEKNLLKTGKELQKVWFATASDGGYDSGMLLVSKLQGKEKYQFLHSGKWKSVHSVMIKTDSFQTLTEDFYDSLGNQISHAIYLKKKPSAQHWQLFQKSLVKSDERLGQILVLDNYHLNGQQHAHLEWRQPHFRHKGSHRTKHHIFLPERSFYFDQQGGAISRDDYNNSVLVWKQQVGRMNAESF